MGELWMLFGVVSGVGRGMGVLDGYTSQREGERFREFSSPIGLNGVLQSIFKTEMYSTIKSLPADLFASERLSSRRLYFMAPTFLFAFGTPAGSDPCRILRRYLASEN